MKGKVLLGVVGGICAGFVVGKYKEKTGERVIEMAKESWKKVKETCENIFVGKNVIDINKDIDDVEDQIREAIKDENEDLVENLIGIKNKLKNRRSEYTKNRIKLNLILTTGIVVTVVVTGTIVTIVSKCYIDNMY